MQEHYQVEFTSTLPNVNAAGIDHPQVIVRSSRITVGDEETLQHVRVYISEGTGWAQVASFDALPEVRRVQSFSPFITEPYRPDHNMVWPFRADQTENTCVNSKHRRGHYCHAQGCRNVTNNVLFCDECIREKHYPE
jgi:hypothetical protein